MPACVAQSTADSDVTVEWEVAVATLLRLPSGVEFGGLAGRRSQRAPNVTHFYVPPSTASHDPGGVSPALLATPQLHQARTLRRCACLPLVVSAEGASRLGVKTQAASPSRGVQNHSVFKSLWEKL